MAPRRYALREAAFEAIADEASAYWLGFLFADGCISAGCNRQPGTVSVALQARDREHLERLRLFVGGPPVRSEPERGACVWYVRSARLAHDLMRLGCTPRKSQAVVVRVPSIPSSLAAHFVRGYFDGDGSAYVTSGSATISLCGNDAFLSTLEGIIFMHTREVGRMPPRATRAHAAYLVYRGNHKASLVGQWLYRDATIWLDRKRVAVASFPPPRRPRKERDFVASIGHVSDKTIQRYIQTQWDRAGS